MSETILLVGHGSRDREGVDEFLCFAAGVQAAYAEHRIQPCFLEFSRPGILDAVDRAVADGVPRIVLMPLFLFASRHMKQDIAEACALAQARYSHIPIYSTRHLGLDRRLLSILRERLAEVEAPGRMVRQTTVLLVGRGSRHPEGNAGIYTVAERLRVVRRGRVAIAFAGLARPDVLTGIRQVVAEGAQRIILVPYLLFTGVLIKRIAAAAAAAQAGFPAVEILQTGPLGGHRYVVDIVRDRIAEALSLKGKSACV